MTNESQWPQWMLNLLWDGGIIPRGSRQIPAYTALDWQQGPNGGLTARPDPLWNHTGGHWMEPFLPKQTDPRSGGLLGPRYESDEPPWFDPGPELKGTLPLPDWVRPVSAEELFTGRPARPQRPTPSESADSGTGGLLGKRYANWPGSASSDALRVRAPAVVQPNGLFPSVQPMRRLDSSQHWGATAASAEPTLPEPPSASTRSASPTDRNGEQWRSESNDAAQDDPRIISDVTPDNDWIPGAQYSGEGHHENPQANYRKLPLPPETRRVFDKATTGQLYLSVDGKRHEFDEAHRAYNEATEELLARFMRDHNIKPEQMTPDHARAVLRVVADSDEPRIKYYREFIRRLQMFYRLRTGRGSE